MKKFQFFVFAFVFLNILQSQNEKTSDYSNGLKTQIDSLIDLSNSPRISQATRNELLGQAFELSNEIKSDSLRIKFLSSLSYYSSSSRLNNLFKNINWETIRLAKDLNDSTALANAFWDRGFFYSKNSVKDSAYQSYSEAHKIFEAQGNSYLSGRMLNNMAIQQLEVKDYVGSEANAIAAIERLKPLSKSKELYYSYNTLAIITQDLEEYEQAIQYYDEALFYLKKTDYSERDVLQNMNNRGMVYQDLEEYEKALEIFKESLSNKNLANNDKKLYAIILSNLAFTKIKLNDTTQVRKLIENSIQINDSLQDIRGLASSFFIEAQYQLYLKDTSKAVVSARKAMRLAKESSSNERLLETYAFLARLENQNASQYAQKYIALNDSIVKEERKARNKFARIRFETDEFIAQNEQLEEETEVLARQKQIWTGVALGFFLLGLSVYIIINQRAKNQKLLFTQQQQANNQEIFNLMLTQKQKVDEVKRLEQKRISEELHDGVLGKMLGARMVLTGLNKKEGQEIIEARMEAIKALKNVEEEVRSISHELSHSAYQKINNFINSVEDLLSSAKENSNIITTFKYDEDEDYDELKGEIKINMYRMIQECLQNTIKHSEADNFFVSFERDGNNLIVEMGDDGKGFDLEKERKGIGMRNISSRIEKLKGQWRMESKPNAGTTIILEIPLYFVDSNTKGTLQNV
ncbi:tetratricopeptide repeat-containing sensor histidine kinase [Maribacter cobaltidurans]|uniref:histidine kinase n=1 Tax=Maribacter cobaltidurans TaxID=1178778 RepID=A0A223V9E4_9FLAO|nr:tetratricopeptide repeat-containing sensor histidine kinase [Maribacter cobaltidurans]ASV32011.1 hypothetical protein CJ263_18310 [Maribacter cobaltidurans]GGD86452.1 hypothetical protein GCM10011412_25360 [Maribacter cobaltidurans]